MLAKYDYATTSRSHVSGKKVEKNLYANRKASSWHSKNTPYQSKSCDPGGIIPPGIQNPFLGSARKQVDRSD